MCKQVFKCYLLNDNNSSFPHDLFDEGIFCTYVSICSLHISEKCMNCCCILCFLFIFQEIEPIKLSWTENSKCFYSEEFKIPTGKYVGNLVIDGVFYPVEDIVVKHYTFEVDLYLKDGRYRSVWVDPEWGTGGQDPPEKSPKNRVSWQYWSRSPEKSQNHQASIRCWAIISMPAKCHLNGILLAGPCQPSNSGI